MDAARRNVLEEDKWDVEALFSDAESWQKEFADFNKDSAIWKNLAAYQNRLNESVKIFKEALELKLKIERELEKLYTYAHLKHDEDTTDTANKERFEKISSALSDFAKDSAWFEPELLTLNEATQKKYLQSPELQDYRFYIEKIFRLGPHTLSKEKEEMFAMAGKPLRTISKAFSSLNNADIKFDPIKDSKGELHPLTHGLYQLYLRSQDRTLRENAFKEMHRKFLGLENTLTELIFGEVEKHAFSASIRGYKSSLKAALFPHNIPDEVYTSLISATRKGLPLLHRYVALRKKRLQLKELHPYDLYVPLVKQVEFSFPYDEAEDLVIEATQFLGNEYQSQLKQGLVNDKWVDRFENENKRSGAYSSGCYDSHPYILMNYRGTLRDVFTLSHEAGHSMHSLLSRLNQNYHDASYPIFVAEVASTFNEELLMHHMLAHAKSKEEKLYLINEKIEDIRTTFFRQTMFAEFELLIHQLVENDVPLTPSLLKEKYLQLNRDYFGPEITLDDELAIEWARIPHFYYNFYVYQYATGISAALSLAEKVLKKEKGAKENYLSFLKLGGSLFPIDLLKSAGIDMTKPMAVEATLRTFETLLNEFEKLSSSLKEA